MKKQEKKRSFRHLNQNDRDRLSLLKEQGYEQKDIAQTIGFSESAISREITKRQSWIQPSNAIFCPVINS